MFYTYGYNLIGSGHTFHGVGVQNLAVEGHGQNVSSGAFYLELCACTVDQVGYRGILCIHPALAIPTVGSAVCTKAGIAVTNLNFVNNTEGIELAIIHSNTQNHGITDFSVTIGTLSHGQIVLSGYTDGFVLAGNILPVRIASGIVHGQDALGLVEYRGTRTLSRQIYYRKQ